MFVVSLEEQALEEKKLIFSVSLFLIQQSFDKIQLSE